MYPQASKKDVQIFSVFLYFFIRIAMRIGNQIQENQFGSKRIRETPSPRRT